MLGYWYYSATYSYSLDIYLHTFFESDIFKALIRCGGRSSLSTFKSQTSPFWNSRYKFCTSAILEFKVQISNISHFLIQGTNFASQPFSHAIFGNIIQRTSLAFYREKKIYFGIFGWKINLYPSIETNRKRGYKINFA